MYEILSQNPRRKSEFETYIGRQQVNHQEAEQPLDAYMRHFIKSMEYYHMGEAAVQKMMDHMEKSLVKYLEAVNDCRARCEIVDYEAAWEPDMLSDLASNTYILYCLSYLSINCLIHAPL